MRKAAIYANKVFAGILTETDEGKYIFHYDDAYRLDESRTAISPSFPKCRTEFVSDTLFPSSSICCPREQTKPISAVH